MDKMPCTDAQGVIMGFHEYYPKDKLHAELLSLRDPWNEQQYLCRFWRDDRPCVFDNLRGRLQWPESKCFLAWKAHRLKHRTKWGDVTSAVGGRYKRKIV